MRAAIIRALVGSAAFAPAAAGAPGDLDGSFSGDGWLRTLEVRSSTNNYLPRGAEDVAVQPDGRIVAVGELIDGVSNWYFGAFRYLPNGELDPSFGEGGWVDTNLGSFEFPRAVALQPNGGIVVAGEGDCRYALCFVLARYRPDGSLDPGFGEGGVVHTSFGLLHGSQALDVSIAPDGRIVAAGFLKKGATRRTARTSPWLATSPTAASTGASRATGARRSTSATATTSPTRSPTSLAAGSSWRVGARATSPAPRDDFAFARFRRNGRLDRAFSGDGKRTINFGGRRFDVAYGLAVRGRSIVATGKHRRRRRASTLRGSAAARVGRRPG